MRLDRHNMGEYSPGAPLLKQLAWYFVGSPIVRSHLLPFSPLKCAALRLFGASIGTGVRIKPGVRVKFPWRLSVGDHSWIGESAWLDNLAQIRIGNHVCISQGVYLCTGSHDWSKETFDLSTKEIAVGDHAWLAARSTVGPGVVVQEGAVLALGSVACSALEPWSIYQGNPAIRVRERPR